MQKIIFSALASLAMSATYAAGPEVRNLAPAFTAAYDASAQLPMPERVAAMKKVLLAQYPEFYGRGTPEKQDASIAYAIETFP